MFSGFQDNSILKAISNIIRVITVSPFIPSVKFGDNFLPGSKKLKLVINNCCQLSNLIISPEASRFLEKEAKNWLIPM